MIADVDKFASSAWHVALGDTHRHGDRSVKDLLQMESAVPIAHFHDTRGTGW